MTRERSMTGQLFEQIEEVHTAGVLTDKNTEENEAEIISVNETELTV